MSRAADTPQVTKRRVTMRGYIADPKTGKPLPIEAVDYVRPDFLDSYVTNARERWSYIEVSEEPDAGPGGYHGATHVPEDLDHPLAGQTFPATDPKG